MVLKGKKIPKIDKRRNDPAVWVDPVLSVDSSLPHPCHFWRQKNV